MIHHAELIRPFALVDGRTSPACALDSGSVLRTSVVGLASLTSVSPFAQQILIAAFTPISVEDLVEDLSIVGSAARIVIADLLSSHMLESYRGVAELPSVYRLVEQMRESSVVRL